MKHTPHLWMGLCPFLATKRVLLLLLAATLPLDNIAYAGEMSPRTVAGRRSARMEQRLQRRGLQRGWTKTTVRTAGMHGAASVPEMGAAVFPVDRIPDWGSMRSPAAWDRSYEEMTDADFVPVPPYDLSSLTIPLRTLTHPLRPENVPILTAKLFYSTRHFGTYDLDAGEFTGTHAGVDLKLARGTPIRAIGSGIVLSAGNEGPLGLRVMVGHRLPDGSQYVSIYGHFETVSVREGDDVTAGQVMGTVGTTGETTAPHLHLQVDRWDGSSVHIPYAPVDIPAPEEADRWSVDPLTFIRQRASP